MLANLQIENIAIIKKAVIDFKDGFNVMTGETGAGKSIIIDSLNAVLGERTSRELIRSGSDFANVSATFYDNSAQVKAVLESLDISPEDDGSIIITRKMTTEGKNTCRINGNSVTVSMLKSLGKQLVNIHGQLDNQALLSPEFHCEYIDRIAENNTELCTYINSYNEYSTVLNKLKSLNVDEEAKMRKLDMLNYQIEEIEKAKIKPGEWEDLKNKQQLFRNAEKIADLLNFAFSSLNGNDETQGAVTLAFNAVNKLQNACSFSDEFNELTSNLEETAYNLSALSDELRDKLESLDFDSSDINRIEERLDILYELSKKYGKTEEEILEFYDNAVQQRDSIENSDELRVQLEESVKKLYDTAYNNAVLLSQIRKKCAEIFCKNVCEELRFLDMPSVKFFVDIKKIDLCENGIDSVEFFLSANVGEEPKPLAKTASGGELSRIMLAIKSVLADKDNIGTLIFDEIDTGVSGRAAQKIAMKLKEVSKNHQVISVTHLAQIAASADEHLLIEKSEVDGKTFTSLKSLDYIGRKFELARIMGGLTVTELLLENADEMLKENGIKQ